MIALLTLLCLLFSSTASAVDLVPGDNTVVTPTAISAPTDNRIVFSLTRSNWTDPAITMRIQIGLKIGPTPFFTAICEATSKGGKTAIAVTRIDCPLKTSAQARQYRVILTVTGGSLTTSISSSTYTK